MKSKPKVVVIEDDIVFANLLELSLRNNGYDAFIIATAKEAIDFIPASKGVDLFIVDYDLGDVKGRGLTRCPLHRLGHSQR